ncbi:MAG: AAA family ATPase, partial [Candidatus Acidiferrales bacterium]
MKATDIKGPLRILRLQAENVKRLVAVDIEPNGNLVQITGRNEQGKSSVLDCILWAIGGKDGIQGVPIRRGESEARIRLDMGEVIVTRKFKKHDSGETTTAVAVEAADGSKFTGPQELLNSFLGALCFDPLAFARMKPAEQFETLRQFVPDIDFNGIDAANKLDFDKRRDINRRQEEAQAGADAIRVSDKAPCDPIDEAALVSEMQSAGERNTDRATRQANRDKAVARIAELRTAAAGKDSRILAANDSAKSAHDAVVSAANDRIQSIEAQIALLQKQVEAEQTRISTSEASMQGAFV